MDSFKLIIGNKNYSSWSLRPWLAMTHFNIPFEEIMVRLDTDDAADNLRRTSPSGKVPLLVHGPLKIWETLAILEYLAELFPEKSFWPKDREARALARSVANEMHSGFADLRSACPMNMRRHNKPKDLSPAVRANVARIETLWQNSRKHYGADGDFLFGQFSNADAMFAPVVSRIESYALAVGPTAQAYIAAMNALPAYQAWQQAALIEPGFYTATENA